MTNSKSYSWNFCLIGAEATKNCLQPSVLELNCCCSGANCPQPPKDGILAHQGRFALHSSSHQMASSQQTTFVLTGREIRGDVKLLSREKIPTHTYNTSRQAVLVVADHLTSLIRRSNQFVIGLGEWDFGQKSFAISNMHSGMERETDLLCGIVFFLFKAWILHFQQSMRNWSVGTTKRVCPLKMLWPLQPMSTTDWHPTCKSCKANRPSCVPICLTQLTSTLVPALRFHFSREHIYITNNNNDRKHFFDELWWITGWRSYFKQMQSLCQRHCIEGRHWFSPSWHFLLR